MLEAEQLHGAMGQEGRLSLPTICRHPDQTMRYPNQRSLCQIELEFKVILTNQNLVWKNASGKKI